MTLDPSWAELDGPYAKLARVLRAYYLALTDAGFAEPDALSLTADWQRSQLAAKPTRCERSCCLEPRPKT